MLEYALCSLLQVRGFSACLVNCTWPRRPGGQQISASHPASLLPPWMTTRENPSNPTRLRCTREATTARLALHKSLPRIQRLLRGKERPQPRPFNKGDGAAQRGQTGSERALQKTQTMPRGPRPVFVPLLWVILTACSSPPNPLKPALATR